MMCTVLSPDWYMPLMGQLWAAHDELFTGLYKENPNESKKDSCSCAHVSFCI